MKVTKPQAKCSIKVRSCPASHFLPSLLTLSQQNHAPCWKPQARASQSPSEGSPTLLAASSSTRHTPCRLRPGNTRTRDPWQSTRATNEKERGEKNSTHVWSGLCSQCQCKLHSGQTAALAPAVNTQEQGLLFCPFAKRLTHAHGEPRPDGGLWGSGRQERQPVIRQHCWYLVMNGNELQGGLSSHLPVSLLDRVSRVLLIRLYSSPSPLLNSIMPSLNLCM